MIVLAGLIAAVTLFLAFLHYYTSTDIADGILLYIWMPLACLVGPFVMLTLPPPKPMDEDGIWHEDKHSRLAEEERSKPKKPPAEQKSTKEQIELSMGASEYLKRGRIKFWDLDVRQPGGTSSRRMISQYNAEQQEEEADPLLHSNSKARC